MVCSTIRRKLVKSGFPINSNNLSISHVTFGSLSDQFSKIMCQDLGAALHTYNRHASVKKHPEIGRTLLYVSVTSKHAHPLF